MPRTSASNGAHRSTESARVLQALDELCAALRPGDRVPTHTKLMGRLQASERTVLGALDALQRNGRIVRRNGVGTFVAEASGGSGIRVPSIDMQRTVVAVTRPGMSFFDRCMDLLFRYTETADLELMCHLIGGETEVVPPPPAVRPLGYIVFGYLLVPVARQLQENGCRVVVVGAPPIDTIPEIPCVYSDHELGGYLITRHLLDLGHRRLVLTHPDSALQQRLRWCGDHRALQEFWRAGKDVEAVLVRHEETESWKQDPMRAARYFRRPGAPTAIVAWNDHEASGLLGILQSAGVKVPEEVSLAGYDALPEGALVYPALTTVDHGIGQQLKIAVDLLTRPAPLRSAHTVVTTPMLVCRASTSAPPAERDNRISVSERDVQR